MKISAQGFGRRVAREDVKIGDLFTASVDGSDLLCLACEARDERLGLVLASRDGSGPEVLTVHLLAELSDPFVRIREKVGVRPPAAKPSSSPYFPARVADEVQPGDLVLDDEGGLYVRVADPSGNLGELSCADLAHGELVAEPARPVTVYPAWELVTLRDGVADQVLARFERSPSNVEPVPPAPSAGTTAPATRKPLRTRRPVRTRSRA